MRLQLPRTLICRQNVWTTSEYRLAHQVEEQLQKLFFATVLVALSLTGARAAPVNPKYNDSPVQCGATYFLIWKGYEQKNQQAMAEVYRRKFESLAAKAAQNLETRGLSKHHADAYMQDHIDKLAVLADTETKAFVDFKELCDSKFPEP